MRDDDDLPPIIIEERGGGWGTFLLGALAGAGIALLLAPRTGRETQRELREVLRGLGEGTQDRVGPARESVAGWVHRSRDSLGGQLGAVRDVVEERLGRVRAAVDEGRVAAHQARSELRRRVDDAKAAVRRRGNGTPPAASITPAVAAVPADEVVITEVSREPDAGDLAT